MKQVGEDDLKIFSISTIDKIKGKDISQSVRTLVYSDFKLLKDVELQIRKLRHLLPYRPTRVPSESAVTLWGMSESIKAVSKYKDNLRYLSLTTPKYIFV